jgi:hypothetical protein
VCDGGPFPISADGTATTGGLARELGAVTVGLASKQLLRCFKDLATPLPQSTARHCYTRPLGGAHGCARIIDTNTHLNSLIWQGRFCTNAVCVDYPSRDYEVKLGSTTSQRRYDPSPTCEVLCLQIRRL